MFPACATGNSFSWCPCPFNISPSLHVMVFGTSFLSGTIDAPHSSCVFSAPALHLASSLSLSLLLGNGFIFIYFLNVSFLFKLKNYLFIYLLFSCVGSSLLCVGFSRVAVSGGQASVPLTPHVDGSFLELDACSHLWKFATWRFVCRELTVLISYWGLNNQHLLFTVLEAGKSKIKAEGNSMSGRASWFVEGGPHAMSPRGRRGKGAL